MAFFSREEMMHVESPIHETELNPPGNNDTAFAINLVQRRRPDNSALGMVNPVFNGVTLALAVSRRTSN